MAITHKLTSVVWLNGMIYHPRVVHKRSVVAVSLSGFRASHWDVLDIGSVFIDTPFEAEREDRSRWTMVVQARPEGGRLLTSFIAKVLQF